MGCRANQFFKLDGLAGMVTRRVSEDFNGFLANASGYQNTQFQKLICPEMGCCLRFRFLKNPIEQYYLLARLHGGDQSVQIKLGCLSIDVTTDRFNRSRSRGADRN